MEYELILAINIILVLLFIPSFLAGIPLLIVKIMRNRMNGEHKKPIIEAIMVALLPTYVIAFTITNIIINN